MEKLAYEEYSGKPKDTRREVISLSGVLDRRRFLLSASPEWKERIKKLQDIVYELKEDLTPIRHFYLGDPEVIKKAQEAVAKQGKK